MNLRATGRDLGHLSRGKCLLPPSLHGRDSSYAGLHKKDLNLREWQAVAVAGSSDRAAVSLAANVCDLKAKKAYSTAGTRQSVHDRV